MERERDLVAGVIQLANLLTRHLGPVFEKARVTPQQWAILSALAAPETAMSSAALARTLLVSKQNMTGMVARLEQLGLVERSGNPDDLRSSRVGLTRRGRSTIEKLRPLYDEWRDALAAALPERDRAVAERAVAALIEELNARHS